MSETGTADVYCFDTSSLVHAAVRAYPFANFVGLWKRLDHLIDGERMIVPDQVFDDLERQKDDLHEWVKKRSERLVVPIDDAQQLQVAEIMSTFEKLVESGSNRSGSDPWVIALAKIRGAVAVHQESHGTPKKPKIPNVCEHYGVRHMTILEVVKAEGWTFT